MTAPARDAQAGSVGLLTLVAGMLFAAVGLAMVVAVTDVAVAAARARTAADAAALAAVAATSLGGGDGDLRAAAGRLADANGARVLACCAPGPGHATGEAPVVVVEVGVRPRLAPLRAVTVPARAGASLRPADEAPPG